MSQAYMGPPRAVYIVQPQGMSEPGVQVQPNVAQTMGPKPTRMICRNCNYEIVTTVETNATMRTHLLAFVLCLLGCWPCVCIPYCVDSFQRIKHYCPNCKTYIGTCEQ